MRKPIFSIVLLASSLLSFGAWANDFLESPTAVVAYMTELCQDGREHQVLFETDHDPVDVTDMYGANSIRQFSPAFTEACGRDTLLLLVACHVSTDPLAMLPSPTFRYGLRHNVQPHESTCGVSAGDFQAAYVDVHHCVTQMMEQGVAERDFMHAIVHVPTGTYMSYGFGPDALADIHRMASDEYSVFKPRLPNIIITRDIIGGLNEAVPRLNAQRAEHVGNFTDLYNQLFLSYMTHVCPEIETYDTRLPLPPCAAEISGESFAAYLDSVDQGKNVRVFSFRQNNDEHLVRYVH